MRLKSSSSSRSNQFAFHIFSPSSCCSLKRPPSCNVTPNDVNLKQTSEAAKPQSCALHSGKAHQATPTADRLARSPSGYAGLINSYAGRRVLCDDSASLPWGLCGCARSRAAAPSRLQGGLEEGGAASSSFKRDRMQMKKVGELPIFCSLDFLVLFAQFRKPVSIFVLVFVILRDLGAAG